MKKEKYYTYIKCKRNFPLDKLTELVEKFFVCKKCEKHHIFIRRIGKLF
ncbi:hypothetical protein LCGC14_1257270 [marine sediment metagenome]|uniref:Uncharacterized protein n=1 Tax=marine sediment metagenome TaxID=412755 RepID=A0A0F9P548_9ZZZZ